jgi:hypothetical protein
MVNQVGDVYEVATHYTFGGSNMYNVFHFKLKAAVINQQAAFLALANALKDLMRPVQNSLTTYVDWRAFQVAGDGVTYSSATCKRTGGDVWEGVHTGTLTGSVAASATGPSYQGLVVNLKTGLVGRSRRGSFYIGGFDNNNQDATNRNRWSAATITSLTTAIASFFGVYNASTGTDPEFAWQVFSKQIASGCKYQIIDNQNQYKTFTSPSPATASAPVTSATPRALIVPMNRRKEGRGI